MRSRHYSWHFATKLTLPHDVAQSIPSNSHIPEDVVKRVLTSQILNGSRPDAICNIEVRYKLSELNGPCTELPLDGYVQSKQKLAEYVMLRWFQARWSPVGGHCSRTPEYIKFCQPDPDYIRLSLCEKAARNKGGRPSKKKEVLFLFFHSAQCHSMFEFEHRFSCM